VTQSEKILALVRHGETEWNRQHRWQGRAGAPLNDLGHRQASSAVEPLVEQAPAAGWHWMITSPLERAVETGARIRERLAAEHGLRLSATTDPDVVERDYGVADGMPSVGAAERWPDGVFPGMESDDDLQRRGAEALRRIATTRAGDGIIVAHGAFIRAAVAAVCDPAAPRILNGSVTLLGFDGARWRAMAYNLVGDTGAVGELTPLAAAL
jgi:broad specificity phosphatase PhoE